VERGVIQRQLETGFNTVSTSSMGRLFDAVASLAGIRQTVTYEAQAAIEFEAMIMLGVKTAYEFDLSLPQTGQPLEIDSAPVIRAVVGDLQAGLPAALIAAKFHQAVANLIVQLSLWGREHTKLNRVALSGGVFQNVTLLTLAVNQLRANHFEVLTHRLVPPNDGGLALGQALIANFSRR
jgi:hydrogenase maturation protein HypF